MNHLRVRGGRGLRLRATCKRGEIVELFIRLEAYAGEVAPFDLTLRLLPGRARRLAETD